MWDNVENENHLATGYAGGAIYDNVKPPKPLAILAIPPPAKFMAASAYRHDGHVPRVPPPPQAAAMWDNVKNENHVTVHEEATGPAGSLHHKGFLPFGLYQNRGNSGPST